MNIKFTWPVAMFLMALFLIPLGSLVADGLNGLGVAIIVDGIIILIAAFITYIIKET